MGLSQLQVSAAAGLSRPTYARIEAGTRRFTTIDEIAVTAAVVGLDVVVRLYPAGDPLRDTGQMRRLRRFLEVVSAPLTWRTEVPLPATTDHPELRAWDAIVALGRARVAVEVEMRIGDGQAIERRFALKRRDDPTEGFLLVVADTRHNRRVLAEHPALFGDLKRLRPSAVLGAMAKGQLPPSGLVLL